MLMVHIVMWYQCRYYKIASDSVIVFGTAKVN